MLLGGFALCLAGIFMNFNRAAFFAGIITGVAFLFYTASLKSVTGGAEIGVISAVNLISAVIFLCALPFDSSYPPSSLKDVITLIMAGALISGLSYVLYGMGVKRTPLKYAMILALAEPLLNPVWVFLATREAPSTVTIIGLLFILAGGVMAIRG